MILAVDHGNTRTKAAVFEQSTLVELFSFSQEAIPENILKIIAEYPTIAKIVVASVGSGINDMLQHVVSQPVFFIDRSAKFPFSNRYATPHTLGIDRMVLAAGAVFQFPRQNRLVIDAGTCITYDFIDSENTYLGGAISPGIRLRYESLHNFTAQLPLLKRTAPQTYIGNATDESIHSGVINGIVKEIDGFIDLYRADYPNFIIILTGGDGEFLANRLKNTIFANSNFLLESLNQTFLYQSKND